MEKEQYEPPKFWAVDIDMEDIICSSGNNDPYADCLTLDCKMTVRGECYQIYCNEDHYGDPWWLV